MQMAATPAMSEASKIMAHSDSGGIDAGPLGATGRAMRLAKLTLVLFARVGSTAAELMVTVCVSAATNKQHSLQFQELQNCNRTSGQATD